ncbi:MAG: insulinase family protein [Zoogloeaceae bacterium]|jgi:zinc protease|nr:insulinase family protein [Zoogloeaceae bacterium]
MKTFSHPIASVFAALFALVLHAGGAVANPYETTLDNGLKVVVKEDHRAPVVTQMLWYRVGSMDEVDGHSGLAHMLEHMMFKGTPKVGAGEFSKRVAAAGGRDNAFTSSDYTAYFQQVPREKLAEMMELEADRMRHLNTDPKEFAQELKVVMEERRMRTEDNPHALLSEQLHAVAFQAHPYRRPVIGWMNDLENMSAQEAQDWHKSWYAPNNATLVVSGDVAHEEVFRLARRYYGSLRARTLPGRKPQREPEQKGVRRLVTKGPAELPYVLLTWKTPGIEKIDGPSEPYALEMLAAILDGHDAARLSRSLVREQRLATSAGASYSALNRGPSLFYLYATPVPGQDVETLEKALRAEVGRIAQEGVTEAELKRAKAQLIASRVYKLDSVFGQAMEIGMLEIQGFAYRDLAAIEARLEAISAKEIQRAAQTWFGDDTLTAGILEPIPVQRADSGDNGADGSNP